jgi:hypothetical protein
VDGGKSGDLIIRPHISEGVGPDSDKGKNISGISGFENNVSSARNVQGVLSVLSRMGYELQ